MRFDREYCGSRVAVEQEDEEDNERRRKGEEEEDDQETDIKSNNPHLAGGEQFEYLLFEKMHLPNLQKARFCNQNCEIHGNLGGQEPGTKKTI